MFVFYWKNNICSKSNCIPAIPTKHQHKIYMRYYFTRRATKKKKIIFICLSCFAHIFTIAGSFTNFKSTLLNSPHYGKVYIGSLILWLLNIICVHKNLNYLKFCLWFNFMYLSQIQLFHVFKIQEKILCKILRDNRAVVQTELLKISGKLFP